MRVRDVFVGRELQESLAEQRSYRERMASPGTVIEMACLAEDPASIEDPDERTASPALLREVIRARDDGVDAVIVECVLDPFLDALRQAVPIPVVGPCCSAYAIAACLGSTFTIICPLESLMAAHRRLAGRYGFLGQLASVRSLGIPLLRVLGAEAKSAFVAAGRKAVEEDGASVLVVGCTGMSPAVLEMQPELPVPLVDPAGAAIASAEMLVRMGLSQNVMSFPVDEHR